MRHGPEQDARDDEHDQYFDHAWLCGNPRDDGVERAPLHVAAQVALQLMKVALQALGTERAIAIEAPTAAMPAFGVAHDWSVAPDAEVIPKKLCASRAPIKGRSPGGCDVGRGRNRRGRDKGKG